MACCMGLCHFLSLYCVLMQVPMGPKVQDNTSGKRSQNRTYTDLLKDEHDMEVCEYYFFDGTGTDRMAGDVLCNI